MFNSSVTSRHLRISIVRHVPASDVSTAPKLPTRTWILIEPVSRPTAERASDVARLELAGTDASAVRRARRTGLFYSQKQKPLSKRQVNRAFRLLPRNLSKAAQRELWNRQRQDKPCRHLARGNPLIRRTNLRCRGNATAPESAQTRTWYRFGSVA